jgi:hypothetical protein
MNQEYQKIIEDEIIVDCYDEYEMAMGWFYYLSENMSFPFKAKISVKHSVGSLKKGDIVNVVELMNSDEDMIPIYTFKATVGIEYGEHIYDVPLEMIEGIDCDKETDEVIDVWRYNCEENR